MSFKGDYSTGGAWLSIALLYLLKQLLESIIAQYIHIFYKVYSLLHAKHILVCPSRSIETAIKFLV